MTDPSFEVVDRLRGPDDERVLSRAGAVASGRHRQPFLGNERQDQAFLRVVRFRQRLFRSGWSRLRWRPGEPAGRPPHEVFDHDGVVTEEVVENPCRGEQLGRKEQVGSKMRS
ncbi:MAG: hypothetical protein CL933_22630 [Deltaproteobacteria bacterium]|nr:hypothetical protein [Deltaproteobacteria bacterium]